MLKLVAPPDEQGWVDRAFAEGGTGYGDMKKRLFEYYMDVFGPARKRFDELQRDHGEVERVLADGARKARETAGPLMEDVRRAVGMK